MPDEGFLIKDTKRRISFEQVQRYVRAKVRRTILSTGITDRDFLDRIGVSYSDFRAIRDCSGEVMLDGAQWERMYAFTGHSGRIIDSLLEFYITATQRVLGKTAS